ncbi:phospholipase A [Gilvimarinus sp. F26214L]|uniref:phospholipase A n=1 Tax=Gilvimarinus sp. DZF01 TaxID=3461371 RepID=UPI004045B3DF
MGLLRQVCLTLALLLLPPLAVAQASCDSIEDDDDRLACYDAAAVIGAAPEVATVLDERVRSEQALFGNRYGILPHRRSYLLPLTYTPDPGRSTLPGDPEGESLQHAEVKFQYSFKVPVGDDFLFSDDRLYFGFTQVSLWQAFNGDLSSPFRETVYEPELLWSLPLRRPFFGGRLADVRLGINHQSNGRGGSLSRSWNRLTFDATWADPEWAFNLRLWHRIPESRDEDDNRDIDDYLGFGELRLGYKWGHYRFTAMVRNNFQRSENHTTADLSISWPLNEKLSGFVQYYNGYGETLVDYDNRVRRIGFGLILSDWF